MTSSSYILQEHHSLQIPIQIRQSENKRKDDDEWIILHKIISSHPCFDDFDDGSNSNNNDNDGIVAAVWQVSTTDPNLHRIAIYSGMVLFDGTANSGFSSSTLHVSFQLPSYAQPPHRPMNNNTTSYSSVLCWTTFPAMQPKHKVLCCLVTTTSLCIWDVYPQSASNDNDVTTESDHGIGTGGGGASFIPSEGWTITLPFECREIFSLPGSGGGLLLQRLEDVEDRVVMSSTVSSAPDDDGFFLKGPPSVINKTHQTLAVPPQTVLASTTMFMEPQLHLPTAISTAVPSLFSLQHPLEDVLPVIETTTALSALSADPRQQSQTFQTCTSVTDVFEQLLWIGTATWVERTVDDTATDEGMMTTYQSAVLAVTYHTILGRHAVWKIEKPSAPPDPLPLYKLIPSQYRCDAPTGVLDAHNDMIMMEDMQLFQETKTTTGKHQYKSTSGKRQIPSPTSGGNLPLRLSRAEALADALGVRRTPRKSLDMPKARYRSSDQQQQQVQQHLGGGSAFFSPSAISPANVSNRSISDHPGGGFSDTYYTNNNNNMVTTTVSGFPPNKISPKTAIICLYREQNDASSAATNVFLATNLESSSKMMLCLVCKRKTRTTRNGHPQELKLFTLSPEKLSHPHSSRTTGKNMSYYNITVQPCKEIIGCVSAQPIEAVPIPSCFHLDNKYRKIKVPQTTTTKSMATDVLVLDKQGSLTLYRSYIPIANCSLSKFQKVLDLENPVGDGLTFRIQDEKGVGEVAVRGKLTLVVENNFLVERILSAIDSSLHAVTNEVNQSVKTFPPATSSSHFLRILALKIRLDCNRMVQALALADSSMASENNRMDKSSCHNPLDNVFLSSLQAVLFGIADYELASTNTLGIKTKQQTKAVESDPWLKLLESEYHQTYSIENSFFLSPRIGNLDEEITMTSGTRDYSAATNKLASIRSLSVQHLRGTRNKSLSESNVFARLFDALHLLHEELKLYLSSPFSERRFIVSLLVEFCQKVITSEGQSTPLMDAFLEHYKNDFGDEILKNRVPEVSLSRPTKKKLTPGTTFTVFSTPPSIFSWLEGTLQCNHNKLKKSSYDHRAVSTINATCSRTRSVLRFFSNFLGATTYISDISTTRQRDIAIVKTLSEEGFVDSELIRDDFPPGISVPILEALYRCRNASFPDLPDWPLEAWSLIGRDDIRKNIEAGLLHYKSDIRFFRPKKHIRSAIRATAVMEAEGVDDKENDGLLSIETLAAMLFRDDNRIHEAARLVRSSRPIFLRVARAVEVSDHDFERLKQDRLLLLSIRALALPIGRGMLTIGSVQPVPAELLPIPELCLKGRVPPTNATLNLDISECPPDMCVWPHFHNGVAAGLRLPVPLEMAGNGFKITRTWIVYNRPPAIRPSTSEEGGDVANQHTQYKSFAHGGLLLALGLRGHLTALEMSDIYDYLTHGTVTTTVGVLLGLAANKRGSCDMSVSKMLCLHIPSLIPQHFSAIDVASSVQTAAIIGAGLLYQKSSHRMMTEFLINEIGKRPDSDVSTFDREAYTLACGLALGTVNLAIGVNNENFDRAAGIADLGIEERLHRYIIGGVDNDENRRIRESNDRFSLPSASGNDNERCSTIFEGNQINTDMTAPGATLALGLMYMKTGNQTIASALALPYTHFLLEFVRPDFLGLRVIARSLILWNEVLPTKKWIELQIPPVVRDAYEEIRSVAKAALSYRHRNQKPRQKPEYDRRAIRQIYAHVVAGACFGMGIRYAGTGDDRAKAALYDRVFELYTLREANDPVSLALKPELPILDMSLGCAAISLAMVMAGTGDLDCLRIFKVLRWRCDKTTTYGSHMVYGMAIGLLFLGGGTSTLGREPEDIACLVTAFLPRFPMSTSDNQYHLQATRHLYALAVKQKELHAIDVDTGASACVPVEILVNAHSPPQRLVAPALLRNTDKVVKHLQVACDAYYPLRLEISDANCTYVFYVKKRTLPLTISRSMALHHGGTLSDSTVIDFLRNAFGRKYSSYLFQPDDRSQLSHSLSESLFQSLVENTDEALLLYLSLQQSIASRNYYGACPVPKNHLRHLQTYYKERKRLVGNNETPLLDTELLLPFLFELMEIKYKGN